MFSEVDGYMKSSTTTGSLETAGRPYLPSVLTASPEIARELRNYSARISRGRR